MMTARRDPFATLGLPETFALAAEELEGRYRERAKEAHPDRYVGASAAERVQAVQRAMDYNEAYKALRKPASRAEAILANHGVVIGEHERLDEATLMEVLEWREELADARAANDATLVAKLERAMKQREATLLAQLGDAMARRDYAEAKHQLIVLRYVGRYLEECDAALDAVS